MTGVTFIGRVPYLAAMFVVFNVRPSDRARIDAALSPSTPQGDLVSRQSVVVREASALGLSGLGVLVLVEGEESALRAAEALFGFAEKLAGEKADQARRAFRAQDDDVAAGVGFIFGG